MRQIATDSSKKISKKDRKEQRTEFRAIEDYILHGHLPDETIHLQGCTITVNSFERMNIIDLLKLVMESGFQSVLRTFPVVCDVLEIDHLAEAHVGSGLDLKVGKGTSTEKSRANNRRQDRMLRKHQVDSYGANGSDANYGGYGDDDC